jgi:pimeloyl-ACP methyl ester carboxylesterase
MGGLFAMAFATAHPERVRLLGLLGASPGLDRAFPLFLRRYANPIIGRVIALMDLLDPETLRTRAFSALPHASRMCTA